MNKFKLFSFLIGIVVSVSAVHADSGIFDEKKYKVPLREISIIATDDGFYPNKIMAFQGERIRFFITSTTSKSQCFILQKHEVFVAAERGKVNEAEIVVDRPGRFKFHCPSTKFTGHLRVFKKFTVEAEEPKRDIASERPKYWTPKDYD